MTMRRLSFDSASDNSSKLTANASRRSFLQSTMATGAVALHPALSLGREVAATPTPAGVKSFELDEITIPELQDGMKSGRFTARSLVEKYSARIEEVDKHGPSLNAVIEMNP